VGLQLAAAAVGGAVGALVRWGLSSGVQRVAGAAFPLGTMVVNLLGCFAIGFLMVPVVERPVVSPEVRSLLLVGFLGSFTTFSTFGFEAYVLLREGRTPALLACVAGNVLLGLVAVWLGRVVGDLAIG
jgi:CrcB protein